MAMIAFSASPSVYTETLVWVFGDLGFDAMTSKIHG
jgi:hypothetical protein